MDFLTDSDKYLSVTERYFTQKYYKNPKQEGEDVCVLVHSNKICIICLAETHPIYKEKKTVLSVDYQFDNVNRLCNKVSGKGKKSGGAWQTIVCMPKIVHRSYDGAITSCYVLDDNADVLVPGGQNLTQDALLCKISCEDGCQYFIPCGLKCQLLETNDILKNSPTTLTEKPLSDGYIAIVMPKLKEFPGEMDRLLTKEAFFNDRAT